MEAIILDRDGVINHDSAEYVKSPEEWHAIDGSLEAIARLCQANIRVYVASNQSGLAYGLFDYDTLFAMHKKLVSELAVLGGKVDAFFFCPHLTGYDRKPSPGMLFDIAARTHINLATTPFVGDAMRDIEAANAANAIPMLVRTGKGEQTLASGEVPPEVKIFTNLFDVVDKLLLDS